MFFRCWICNDDVSFVTMDQFNAHLFGKEHAFGLRKRKRELDEGRY